MFPWKKDDLRDRPNDRQLMFDHFKKTLDQHKKKYRILEGDHKTRLKKAIEVIDGFLKIV